MNWRNRVTMPIYDLETGRVVFQVDVYGLTARDMAVVPGGAEPLIHAVKRLGLDPNRYVATILDLPLGGKNGKR